MEYLKTLIDWIQVEVHKAKAKGVIVGISGGIDSALVAYLAKQAFPNNCLGLLLPINNDREQDVKDGLELVNHLNMKYELIDLSSDYESIVAKVHTHSQLVKGNLQARLRMSLIYAFAQENNYLVLGTDNKSEYELGYFTKWGDGGCDLLPIVNLYKSQVFDYARAIGLPHNIINKKPSAGFWVEQYDEDELGFTYDDFEKYKKGKLEDLTKIKQIKKQISLTEHKRKMIPHGPKKGE